MKKLIAASLVAVLLCSHPLLAADHPSYDKSLERKIETILHLGYGLTTTASIVIRKLRKIGVPVAATMGAAAFALRSFRTYRKLNQAKNEGYEGLNKKEIRHLQFDFWYSVALVPIIALGLPSAMGAINGGGWRSLVPFAIPKNGNKYKTFIIGTTFAGGLLMSRYIDWMAHEKRGINPLKSHNFAINTVYDLVGGILCTLALNNSGTLLGRLKSAGIMSASYTLVNSYVQEVQRLLHDKQHEVANVYFDTNYGMFVANPRNLLIWAIFHRMAAKATGYSSAFVATTLWNAFNFAQRYERRVWYSNSKLTYLTTEKRFWRSIFTRKWSDFAVWRKKDEQSP